MMYKFELIIKKREKWILKNIIIFFKTMATVTQFKRSYIETECTIHGESIV